MDPRNGFQLTHACMHQSEDADQCRHQHGCLCMQEMAMCTHLAKIITFIIIMRIMIG